MPNFGYTVRYVDKGAYGFRAMSLKAQARVIKHHRHLAIDVELALIESGVTHANRPGAFVAVQPFKLHFGKAPLSANAIHDLHLARVPRDRSQHPLEKCLPLVPQACENERTERKRSVPQPAKAVVPVANPAWGLGQ